VEKQTEKTGRLGNWKAGKPLTVTSELYTSRPYLAAGTLCLHEGTPHLPACSRLGLASPAGTLRLHEGPPHLPVSASPHLQALCACMQVLRTCLPAAVSASPHLQNLSICLTCFGLTAGSLYPVAYHGSPTAPTFLSVWSQTLCLSGPLHLPASASSSHLPVTA